MTAGAAVSGDLLVHLRRARDLVDRDYAEPLDLMGEGFRNRLVPVEQREFRPEDSGQADP